LIEFGWLVLEKKILKIFSLFLHFCYFLPLENGNPLHLNKLETPSPKDDLCQEKVENVKVYRQTDGWTTDNG
jgi:hypothetical protein